MFKDKRDLAILGLVLVLIVFTVLSMYNRKGFPCYCSNKVVIKPVEEEEKGEEQPVEEEGEGEEQPVEEGEIDEQAFPEISLEEEGGIPFGVQLFYTLLVFSLVSVVIAYLAGYFETGAERLQKEAGKVSQKLKREAGKLSKRFSR